MAQHFIMYYYADSITYKRGEYGPGQSQPYIGKRGLEGLRYADTLVPQRKKSKMINELLKKEIEKIKRRKEEKAFASAFKEAAQDRERLAVSDEWNILDREQWD